LFHLTRDKMNDPEKEEDIIDIFSESLFVKLFIRIISRITRHR